MRARGSRLAVLLLIPVAGVLGAGVAWVVRDPNAAVHGFWPHIYETAVILSILATPLCAAWAMSNENAEDLKREEDSARQRLQDAINRREQLSRLG